MQSNNQRGSFLSRASDALDRLAEMTKGKHETRTGSGANSGSANFVFASVSKEGGAGAADVAEQGADGGKTKTAAVTTVTRKRKSVSPF